MATKRKTTKNTETQAVAVNEAIEQPVGPDLGPDPEIEIPTNIMPTPVEIKTSTKKPKFKTGDIVFISKEADVDLNGFKLFPQYKKYTYTVEAYDAISDVYTLRRLNLSLRLPTRLILAPNERAHDPLHRRQF